MSKYDYPQLILLLLGLFFLGSCQSTDHDVRPLITINHQLIDSIVIQSTDEVLFMNADYSTDRLLFLERAANSLILYDKSRNEQTDLSYLKNKMPLANRVIQKAHLSGDVLFVINDNGYFKYHLTREELIFSHNAVMAKVIPGTEVLIPYSQDEYITNLLPYFDVPNDKHAYVVCGIVKSDGEVDIIYSDKSIPKLVDVRPHLIINRDSNIIANYNHPLSEVSIGDLRDLIEPNFEFQHITMHTPFLKNHPYHLNIDYGMRDLPNIPTTYSVFASKEHVFLHNWSAPEGMASHFVYDNDFRLYGRLDLESSIYQFRHQFEDGSFLCKLFNVEYDDYTVFRIIALEE